MGLQAHGLEARAVEQAGHVRVQHLDVEVEAHGVEQRALRLQHGRVGGGEEVGLRVPLLRATTARRRRRRRRQRVELRVVLAEPGLEQLVGQLLVTKGLVVHFAGQEQRGGCHDLQAVQGQGCGGRPDAHCGSDAPPATAGHTTYSPSA